MVGSQCFGIRIYRASGTSDGPSGGFLKVRSVHGYHRWPLRAVGLTGMLTKDERELRDLTKRIGPWLYAVTGTVRDLDLFDGPLVTAALHTGAAVTTSWLGSNGALKGRLNSHRLDGAQLKRVVVLAAWNCLMRMTDTNEEQAVSVDEFGSLSGADDETVSVLDDLYASWIISGMGRFPELPEVQFALRYPGSLYIALSELLVGDANPDPIEVTLASGALIHVPDHKQVFSYFIKVANGEIAPAEHSPWDYLQPFVEFLTPG